MTALREAAGRLTQNAPRKLASVAVALLVWWIVASDSSSTAQRSLLVPIVVEGVSSAQVVVGLPAVAEVTVSGPSARVDRLRPESFEAVLDLAGVTGDFQVRITVAPPQGIVLEQVVPREVIGIVETVAAAVVPVVPATLGGLGPDLRERVVVTPAQAQVRGRAAVVASVMAVVVPLPVVDALAGSSAVVLGYAVDEGGRPLAEVQVAPPGFTLDWELESVWVERRLPLDVEPLPAGLWSQLNGAPPDVSVLGPASVLAGLDRVVGEVDLPTEDAATGRYTRPLRLSLPSGVVALEAPSVNVTFTEAPIDP